VTLQIALIDRLRMVLALVLDVRGLYTFELRLQLRFHYGLLFFPRCAAISGDKMNSRRFSLKYLSPVD